VRIIVLGSGSIVPSTSRFSSGVYVDVGRTELLFDIGPGTIEKMRHISITPFNISILCLSHFHVDHVSDLPALLKLRAFTTDGLPHPSPPKLTLIAPKGVKKFLERMIDQNEFFSYIKELMRYERYTDVLEVGEWETLELNDIRITAAPVSHVGGVAYRLDHAGRSLVYSGDTSYDENIVSLAKGVDVLIHECSFPREHLVGQHVSEAELARIVRETKPRVVIVTHLYPIWEGREDQIVRAVESVCTCKLIVARDLLDFVI